MKNPIYFATAGLLLSSNLFAYTVTTTRLTEEIYESVDSKYVSFAATRKADDIDLATITLNFDPQEIGTDGAAVMTLGRKEAAKLGATSVRYVSGTVYKNTEEIASETFHIYRNPAVVARISLRVENERQAEEKEQHEKRVAEYDTAINKTQVGQRLMNAMKSFSSLPKAEQARRMGCKTDVVTMKNGKQKRVWYELATNKELDREELWNRMLKSEILTLMEKEPALYKSDYIELNSLNDHFLALDPQISVIPWIQPPGADQQTTEQTSSISVESTSFRKESNPGNIIRTLSGGERIRIYSVTGTSYEGNYSRTNSDYLYYCTGPCFLNEHSILFAYITKIEKI